MVRYMSTLLVLLIAVPGFAAAWVRSIHVEWTYTPPIEPEVEGFVLYRGGQEVCRWDGADIRSGECELVINSMTTEFTLTAAFVDSTESPHSVPFSFNDALPSPSITIINR